MTTLNDYRTERLKKLQQIRDHGIDPYPAKSHRDTQIADLTTNYTQLENTTVTIAGRITAIRSFGKIAFIRLRDYSGTVQIFMQKAPADSAETASTETETAPKTPVEEPTPTKPTSATTKPTSPNADQPFFTLKNLKLLDTGDFIEATGTVNKTQTGEISLFANAVRLLTKSLRPLPGHDGFTNKEERYRRRYVDMNVNLEVRDRMVRRSKFWQATRDFMNSHGFIEINTPILEHTTGGADATPFTTHLDALDEDLYLRISHELPLKRLLGAGFEKVYDIGPRFRNEGIDDEHLPEHIAFESYSAYEDYEDGIKFYESMLKYIAEQTWGTLNFHVNGFDIDLSQPWPRHKYADLLAGKFHVDVFQPDRIQLQQLLLKEYTAITKDKSDLKRLHHEFTADTTPTSRLLDWAWKLIRKTSAGPYWLIEEPLSLSPLAKILPSNPLVTQRFHPIIAGTEMGNGYSELNDPLDQLARFQEQQALRDAGDSEAQMLDQDFVEMLEYGMPPACGWGNSERNFWLLEGVSGREAVPFPLIKSAS